MEPLLVAFSVSVMVSVDMLIAPIVVPAGDAGARDDLADDQSRRRAEARDCRRSDSSMYR